MKLGCVLEVYLRNNLALMSPDSSMIPRATCWSHGGHTMHEFGWNIPYQAQIGTSHVSVGIICEPYFVVRSCFHQWFRSTNIYFTFYVSSLTSVNSCPLVPLEYFLVFLQCVLHVATYLIVKSYFHTPPLIPHMIPKESLEVALGVPLRPQAGELIRICMARHTSEARL